jgi:aromatic ring-opening dioxygenase LigB subunit
MPVVYACICPPEPPAAGARATEALDRVVAELRMQEPETVVVIARQGAVLPRAIQVATGDAERSGAIAARLKDEVGPNAIPFKLAIGRWPAVIAAPIVEVLGDTDILSIGVSSLSLREHLDFGRALGRALAGDERRTALICAARLSNARDARLARLFDRQYRRAIEEWDVKWLANVDSAFRRSAAEDAIAQTAVLMGALSGYRIQPRVLSYERADAAGCLVAAIDVLGSRRERPRAQESAVRVE